MRLRGWMIVAAVIALPVLVLLSTPWWLPWVTLPEFEKDFSEKMAQSVCGAFADKTVRLRGRFVKVGVRTFRMVGRGTALGRPFSSVADIDCTCFPPSAAADATVDFDDSELKLKISARWRLFSGWTAKAELSPAPLDERDFWVSRLLPKLIPPMVSNLVFRGQIALEAQAANTNGVPNWTARARLEDFSASAMRGPDLVSLSGLRMRLGANGYGGHVEIAPLFPRITAVTYSNVAISNVYASVRATEKAYLVTEAGADAWGGQLRLYSLFLDPATLNAGVTVFADDIDSGSVLSLISGFRGRATGRLHGKLVLRMRKGERIALGDTYLYSIPGELGQLEVEDADPIIDNLALGGVNDATRENLTKALRHLSYSALNLQLRKDGDIGHVLKCKLEGTATEKGVSVPVNLNITLRGAIEQLINTGLSAGKRR